MKVAIDINDVLRDFSNNFLKYYLDLYNHEFDLTDFEFFSNDLKLVFPFQNDDSYHRFMYDNYSFELFAKCPTCGTDTAGDLKRFVKQVVPDFKDEEGTDVILVSTMEYGASIGATYFFISKLNPSVREVYMPKDSLTIWDKCDVLITANPTLLDNKPDGKTSIKIKADYNKDCEADYTFSSFKKLVNDEEIIKKLSENG